MGKVTYSLRLPNEEYDQVIRAAESKGQTVREWLRRAVKEHLRHQLASDSCTPKQ